MAQKRSVFITLIILLIILGVAFTAYRALSPAHLPETGGNTEFNAAPDFRVSDENGNEVDFRDLLDKPVIVHFWASWCGVCEEEYPLLSEAYENHGDEVRFMMIDLCDGVRETAATAKAFVERNGYSFPIYLDDNGEAAAAYGVSAIPQTYFINRKGEIVAEQIGAINEKQLNENIAAILE